MKVRSFHVHNLAEFTDILTQRLKEPKDWTYLVMRAPEGKTIDVWEVVQTLEFEFQDQDPVFALSQPENLIIMVTKSKAFGMYQSALTKDPLLSKLETMAFAMNDKGLEYLATTLESVMNVDDAHAKSGIMRMRRRSNLFLVLDDDPMVLKQMEKMLKAFGHAEVFANPEDFILAYRRYAPNAIFVDVHLRGARGTNVPVLIQSRIDQYVHTVIISSDTQADLIQEAKTKGAKGYISKPLSHEQVCKQVLATPSFVTNRSAR